MLVRWHWHATDVIFIFKFLSIGLRTSKRHSNQTQVWHLLIVHHLLPWRKLLNKLTSMTNTFRFSLMWIVRPAMDELGIISIAGTTVFLSAFVGEYGNYLVQKVWPEGGLADQVDLLADAGFLDPYGLYCLYASFAAACLTIILCVWTLYLLGVKATSVVEADKDSQVRVFISMNYII